MAGKRKVRVLLVGDGLLKQKLRNLTDAESRRVIQGATRDAVKLIQKAAVSLAPKRSGLLSRSIKVRAIRRSRTRIGMRVTTAKSDSLFQGRTFYAGFQEFGWKTGARKNTLERTAGRIARDLRRQSREAGGLASRRGTAADAKRRAMQERFFAGEGLRRASAMSRQVRKQIEGKHFMKRAADTTRDAALATFYARLDDHIKKVMAKRK